MGNPKKSEAKFPKITESLLTLLLLHGEIGFIIALFKLCSLDVPQTSSISTEEAAALLWMTFRSVIDMFMALRFFFAHINKNKCNNAKYSSWISYGMFAICFDTVFAIILFQKSNSTGIEVTSLVMDSLVKLTISAIMNDLRRKSKAACLGEQMPLLV